jgi:hypothetical protein
MRSRSHSANSAYTHDYEKPVRDWDIEEVSELDLPGGFTNPSVVHAYEEDSEISIEKNPDDLASDESDRVSEHTQYSHLAAVVEKNLEGINSPRHMQLHQSPGTGAFHRTINLPLSTTSSAGAPVTVPMSVGEMVDNRLLREQSEDAESPLNYATYV